jgi:ABC-2 type transport system ATP-binding protein
MEEAEKLSDRICIIDRGKLLAKGTAEEIISKNGYANLLEVDIDGDIENKFLPFIDQQKITSLSVSGSRITFDSRNPELLVGIILKIVHENNLKIKSLQMRKKSLEDIFINLTGRSLRE